MKLLYTNILLVTTTFLSAQSMDKSRISNAGTSFAEGGISLSFTIGEPIVGMVTNEESIDQGFWAGSLIVESITKEENLDGILVYPNPVADELTVFTNNQKVFGITLFAVNGQRALQQEVDASLLEHKIAFNYLTKGVYVLRLYVEGDNKGKLFKIIKK